MLELPYARRAQRHVVDLPCSIIGPVWDEPLSYEVGDMSAHGMWVRTSFPFKRGEHEVVQFHPPAPARGSLGSRQPELTVFARVARVEHADSEHHRAARSGMGLEFCHMLRQERRALQRGLRGLPVLPESVELEHASKFRPRLWRAPRGRW